MAFQVTAVIRIFADFIPAIAPIYFHKFGKNYRL